MSLYFLKKYLKLRRKGFSLIEVVITMAIISIGLVGVLSFYSMNIQNQTDVKNEIIAANLAQECTEFARNLRDYNVLNSGSRTWDQNLTDSHGCQTIDLESSLGSRDCITDNTLVFVCVDNATFSYYQCDSSSQNTNFQRTMTISPSSDSLGWEIDCEVSWDSGDRTTKAKDILYQNSF